MSHYFADYDPHPTQRRAPPPDLSIRPARPGDEPSISSLFDEREGQPDPDRIPRLLAEIVQQQSVHPPTRLLFVATLSHSQRIAFARASYFAPPPGSPPNIAPAGWYLGGVTVAVAHRRQGIGAELTKQRLNWISQRAAKVYYFANALNRATIDLHAKFGFVELTRDFSFPNSTFRGGVGILFHAKLTPPCAGS